MSIRSRLHNWILRRIALPALNRELQTQGIHFYRYCAGADRLFPYSALSVRGLDAKDAGRIPSDDWYDALAARQIDVDVAFDVGVNYGYTSVWLSRWAKQVYSFEPNPRNAAFVEEQIRIRGIQNVELTQTAVSDHEGEAVLHVKPFDGHHSLDDIGASETTDRISVPVTTLDRQAELRGIERIGLLKIDVEGFEPEVLRGASGLLKARAIDLILFEYSPQFYVQRGLDTQAPLDVLEEFGYRLSTIKGETIDRSTLHPRRQIDLIAEPA